MSRNDARADAPLRVALFGFGVVGEGVYERLLRAPGRYRVVGVVCREPARHIARGHAPELFVADWGGLPEHDIFVEAIGGVSPAREATLAVLARGVDVVTANKTLVSRAFNALHTASLRSGAQLRFSAAVGGGVPMLEAVEEAARRGAIQRIDAVLNGTTNFVLDRIGAGLSVAEAIRLAQEAGFAEADPSADIDGIDASEKIALLARRAFGGEFEPDAAARDPLSSIAPDAIVRGAEDGAPIKQVASAVRGVNGVRIEVRLRPALASDPLSRPRREENCLVITPEFGPPVILHGKGAGRDPTADSVLSDLEAIAAERRPALARA